MGGGGSPPSREDPQAAYQAGVAAMNAQNYREAIRQFRAARRALPDNGTINFALGRAYVGNNEDDEAQNAFERADRRQAMRRPALGCSLAACICARAVATTRWRMQTALAAEARRLRRGLRRCAARAAECGAHATHASARRASRAGGRSGDDGLEFPERRRRPRWRMQRLLG